MEVVAALAVAEMAEMAVVAAVGRCPGGDGGDREEAGGGGVDAGRCGLRVSLQRADG